MAEGFRGLVVDDDAVSQQIVRAVADAGVVSDAASSGPIARHLSDINRYDIVVTDKA